MTKPNHSESELKFCEEQIRAANARYINAIGCTEFEFEELQGAERLSPVTMKVCAVRLRYMMDLPWCPDVQRAADYIVDDMFEYQETTE